LTRPELAAVLVFVSIVGIAAVVAEGLVRAGIVVAFNVNPDRMND